MYSAPTAVDKTVTTVKIDNKVIFIPEVKLNRKVNPITSFLYIGSWERRSKGTNVQKSSCEIEWENNKILIQSPESLLENSRTRVVTQSNVNSFLSSIAWSRRQVTHIAFKVMSDKRLPAVIETFADSDIAVFNNGKLTCEVSANSALAAGGRAYLPVMLEKGVNIINIKLFSEGRPRFQMSVCLDHSHDLLAAWQTQGGLLTNLVITPKGRAVAPIIKWSPCLSNFSIALEMRDVSTNTILLQREVMRQGKISDNEGANFTPGVYEIVYRSKNESASEFFVIGDPKEQYAKLREELLKYNVDPSVKLNLMAQLRRGQVLLSRKNYDTFDKAWQEKVVYTLGCLASFKRKLAESATNISKDLTGLHIRGFASKADNSAQFYRLFVPSNYKPDTPLPLLVIAPTRITRKDRPFIKGPVMANHRDALFWAGYAEKYGFAILWPGYRGIPDGYSYESMHIDEAIQAVEKDYNIDQRRISAYGACSAGYNAGRLVSEYPNRFAAIVYDRAVFNLKVKGGESTLPLKAWREAINPVRHILENRSLKIFVMNDNTKTPGHGEMALTTQFLEQAKTIRDDIVSYLDDQPMGASRMDMVFSWIAQCQNEYADDVRASAAAKAGYTGPISEAFTTPILVVEGTHALGNDLKSMQKLVASLTSNYKKYFHGAKCIVKKDNEVTQEDINSNSLILVGNPQINSVWEKMQPDIAVKMTQTGILYKNETLTERAPFEAIVCHPYAPDKYILMIGAENNQSLRKIIITRNFFSAWYECRIFDPSRTTIGKLDDMHNTTSIQKPVEQPNSTEVKASERLRLTPSHRGQSSKP